MARFKCDRCGFDGHREWTGVRQCPACWETSKLRIAIGIEESDPEIIRALEANIARHRMMIRGGDQRRRHERGNETLRSRRSFGCSHA